jgi:hypothetical protein
LALGDAANDQNRARSFRRRDDRRDGGSRPGRGIVRHKAQENFRAYADSDAAQAHEKEIDCGEITNAETERDSGKIRFAKEKSGNKSTSFRDGGSQPVGVSEKEKVVAYRDTRGFADRSK